MALVFPGMDPYLEHPWLWPGVHSRLVVYIGDQLQPRMRPRYVAAVEERVYLEVPDRYIRPDVSVRLSQPSTPLPGRVSEGGGVAVLEEVQADAPRLARVRIEPVSETYIAVLDLHAGQRVVTVIEVVSPTNKRPGPGRESYLSKQREVFTGGVHLVEIDLLRQGPHVALVPETHAREFGPFDYLTCVNRAAGARDVFELYPTRLRDRLPRIAVPLADGDPDVTLDVQAVVARTHEAGAYRDRIDYTRACDPPLTDDDQAWAASLTAAAPGKPA